MCCRGKKLANFTKNWQICPKKFFQWKPKKWHRIHPYHEKGLYKTFSKRKSMKNVFFPFPHVPPDKLGKILILAVPGWRSPINQLIWLRSVKNPFAPSLSCILSIETSKFTSILAKILQECRDQSKLITLYYSTHLYRPYTVSSQTCTWSEW